MKKILFVCLAIIAPWLVQAQNLVYKKSLRATVEAVNVSDSRENRRFSAAKYSLLFTKQLSSTRWSIESGLGYIGYYAREQFFPYNTYCNGDRSQRISADFAVLYNLVKGNRFAFRVGLGPSVWYQRNGYVRDLSGIVIGQQIGNISFTRLYTHEFNVGLNFRSDVECKLTHRIIVGARVGIIGNLLRPDAQSSLNSTLTAIGLSVGYRF